MRRVSVIIGLVMLCQLTLAQDKKIDQLEILYDQGYYKKVLRKSNALLAHPEYDYSGLPSFYRSLALFRLAEDSQWKKRHKMAITEAVESYGVFAEHSAIDDYIHAHYYEIAGMKSYLEKLTQQLKELGEHQEAELLFKFTTEHMINIKAKPDPHENLSSPDVTDHSSTASDYREGIVEYAKTFLGIKYVWAGADENGFDCSGFTSYVLKKYGIVISRTASGQMEAAKKIKVTNAVKGDLVFFGSGEKITHVGMVVSGKGEELSMIHASTSKGVIITNIVTSTYWEPKLKAAGTYLD